MNDPPHDYLFKVLTVGDAKTGKSSLLLRFCDATFVEHYELTRTIGVDFRVHHLTLEDVNASTSVASLSSSTGARIRLQVWDTSGQERFHTIAKAYFSGVDVVFLAFDIANADSFARLDDLFREVKHTSTTSATATAARTAKQDTQFILVGCKADLEQQRQVPRDAAQSVASKHNLQYFETSAKTDTNVDKMFNSAIRLLVQARNTRFVATSIQTTPFEVTTSHQTPNNNDDGAPNNSDDSPAVSSSSTSCCPFLSRRRSKTTR
jgi:small GTP-binding protein